MFVKTLIIEGPCVENVAVILNLFSVIDVTDISIFICSSASQTPLWKFLQGTGKSLALVSDVAFQGFHVVYFWSSPHFPRCPFRVTCWTFVRIKEGHKAVSKALYQCIHRLQLTFKDDVFCSTYSCLCVLLINNSFTFFLRNADKFSINCKIQKCQVLEGTFMDSVP